MSNKPIDKVTRILRSNRCPYSFDAPKYDGFVCGKAPLNPLDSDTQWMMGAEPCTAGDFELCPLTRRY